MTRHTTSRVNLWEKHRWNSKPETWKAAFLSHAFPTRTPKPWLFQQNSTISSWFHSLQVVGSMLWAKYSNCHTTVTKSAGVTAPNWAPIVAVKTPILNLWQLGHLWHSHKIKKPSLMSHPSCLETCLQRPITGPATSSTHQRHPLHRKRWTIWRWSTMPQKEKHWKQNQTGGERYHVVLYHIILL